MLQKKKITKEKSLCKRRTWSCGLLSPLFRWLFVTPCSHSLIFLLRIAPLSIFPLRPSRSVFVSVSVPPSASPPPSPGRHALQLTQGRRLPSRARPLEAAPRAPCAAGGPAP